MDEERQRSTRAYTYAVCSIAAHVDRLENKVADLKQEGLSADFEASWSDAFRLIAMLTQLETIDYDQF